MPHCSRLLVLTLAEVQRTEIGEHAAGAVAVAQLGEERHGRLVGVERTGLVARAGLGQADPVERQRLASPVAERPEDLERLLPVHERFLVPALLAQIGCLLVQAHGLGPPARRPRRRDAPSAPAPRQLSTAAPPAATVRLEAAAASPPRSPRPVARPAQPSRCGDERRGAARASRSARLEPTLRGSSERRARRTGSSGRPRVCPARTRRQLRTQRSARVASLERERRNYQEPADHDHDMQRPEADRDQESAPEHTECGQRGKPLPIARDLSRHPWEG